MWSLPLKATRSSLFYGLSGLLRFDRQGNLIEPAFSAAYNLGGTRTGRVKHRLVEY